MPRAFSEQEKELIGERLLEQGYKLFSTYGLKKTNVEDIAKAAGISKGAFYSFYESKEALLMDVIEEAEVRLRQEIFEVVDLPGPSPRARLYAILKKAFELFEEIPILQFFTGSDYDLLFRRVPAEKLQEHLASDQAFFNDLIARCHRSGIPIQVQPGEIASVLYPIVMAMLHSDESGWSNLSGNLNVLLELLAAYCLGEVELQLQDPDKLASGRKGESSQ
ncbi:MAG: TetR/AcrR family transcriptional regulator [Chloroflexota bacterium]